ncbi:BREX-1 system phosphatase PglZ type B [Gallibacterium anatis]|uniref:BREX-1 system phosphatase PglZ type B n=1 Tax=Gallibacterium anatis TaxID=750 RepID=UPI0005315CA0|nr:BREX-1 system phosphatase PglZ type B [Gallibacterium anatis]KGQ42164.1 alkaline phosphatase [Gallibacterium anatis]KGQ58284.1 alkaline phosphatase [Gallibacterium anatis]KGQ64467.1 alkaline phosphatase [Gallibacterium anatis]
MKILNHFINTLQKAAVFNPDIQSAPACILWTDKERQWESIIPLLQTKLPELMVLGDYAPEKRTGPAIWLRCVLARQIEGIDFPVDTPTIFYLPNVSRQDLRAVDACPDALKPLAELQYRGVIWSQLNAKDWTVLAYLKSEQGGLGLNVAKDNDSKKSMLLALKHFFEEDSKALADKYLDKDYFNGLLIGGDPVRDLLQWLNDAEAFQAACETDKWQAFLALCQSRWAFQPEKDGVLAGIQKLLERHGDWREGWERFCESPQRYPQIPKKMRQLNAPKSLFWLDDDHFNAWPQWNEDLENELRKSLLALKDLPAAQARTQLLALEAKHGQRRHLVWAALGEAPLAHSLEWLAVLMQQTQKPLSADTAEHLAERYTQAAWLADDAVLRALSYAEKTEDFTAISSAIRTVYLPWLEDSARCLQQLTHKNGYLGGDYLTAPMMDFRDGDCVLFVDGLRFDAGKRLATLLAAKGHEVAEKSVWAALPSVTATGKPAVSPVRSQIAGNENSTDFEPSVAATGQSLKGGYHFKKLLSDAGWLVLEAADNGNGHGSAWCAFGDIDSEGHQRGWKLAKHLDNLLAEIGQRIDALLSTGWKRVHVVTDHGWLLLPEGLPKIDLPSVLTESKWGRCAALKAGVETVEHRYPWYWNPNLQVALADGISCFKKGEEYAHGGLSLQECLTLQLTVIAGEKSKNSAQLVDIHWKGLRCYVEAESDATDLFVDIRFQAGNPDTSVVNKMKVLGADSHASVVVTDEDLVGQSVFVVLTDKDGILMTQRETVIGGE